MTKADDPFRVTWLTHHLGAWVEHCRDWLVALGRIETASLADQLRRVAVDRPVYVCGLARSGSTLLHLALAGAPGTATHRAKDYPLVYTPFWTRQASAKARPTPLRERAHGDRVLIGPDSPEALEEMVWMAFFPRCHDPRRSAVLDGQRVAPAFDSFYRDHLRKLMHAEGAARYVAKANYHVARLGYLLRLFPDARFVIPVREPVAHIASLARQHERFSAGERRHPRALAHMRRVGHFEFGLDRRPISFGDAARVQEVERSWARGGVRGWALYWAMVHDHVADRLQESPALRAASLVVRHEALCANPAETLAGVFRHCGLPLSPERLASLAATVSRPDYYRSPFTPAEAAEIQQETAAAAQRWGYP